jgi:hypothetical protein
MGVFVLLFGLKDELLPWRKRKRKIIGQVTQDESAKIA